MTAIYNNKNYSFWSVSEGMYSTIFCNSHDASLVFAKIPIQYLWLWIVLIMTKTEHALKPRGLTPFPVGKGCKRTFCTALRQPSIYKPRWNPFGEPSQTRPLTRSQTHGKARFLLLRMLRLCAATKIPSRATQSDSAGAALAYRKLFKAQSIFNANLFCETNLCTQDVVTQPMVKISKQFSR